MSALSTLFFAVSFEWDEQKRLLNLRKHRIDFAEAVSALEDDNALTIRDEDVAEEDRFVTLGSDSDAWW